MKRFICFIIAVFILFSIAFPCFAELREDGNGEWVSEGNDQAHWIDGITTTHFKVEGDFNDENNGFNGCVGFMIGEFPENSPFSESTALCLFSSGNGNFGYTTHAKWWSYIRSYNVSDGEGFDRFCHIEVEWEQTEDNVLVRYSCNDTTILINMKELLASEERYNGLELFSAKSVCIAEKIKGGRVKNLKFTDLYKPYELLNNSEWTVEDNIYNSPKHTEGYSPEYYLLGEDNSPKINFVYSPNSLSCGVMFAAEDVNRDGTIDTDDRYYYAAIKDGGDSIGIKRIDRSYSPWAVEVFDLGIKEGDVLTFEYKKEFGLVTVAVNGNTVFTYTDDTNDIFTGELYALASMGETTFTIVDDNYQKPVPTPDDIPDAERTNTPIFIILSAAAGLTVGVAVTLIAVNCKKKKS